MSLNCQRPKKKTSCLGFPGYLNRVDFSISNARSKVTMNCWVHYDWSSIIIQYAQLWQRNSYLMWDVYTLLKLTTIALQPQSDDMVKQLNRTLNPEHHAEETGLKFLVYIGISTYLELNGNRVMPLKILEIKILLLILVWTAEDLRKLLFSLHFQLRT